MNRRQRRFPSQSKFALLATGAATLAVVLSSAIIVASSGAPAERDALARSLAEAPALDAPASEPAVADASLADLPVAGRAGLSELGVGGIERASHPEPRLGDLTEQ